MTKDRKEALRELKERAGQVAVELDALDQRRYEILQEFEQEVNEVADANLILMPDAIVTVPDWETVHAGKQMKISRRRLAILDAYIRPNRTLAIGNWAWHVSGYRVRSKDPTKADYRHVVVAHFPLNPNNNV